MCVERLSLSILLPVGEGGGALAALVGECLATATEQSADLEIILSDDGTGAARQADLLAATHSAVGVIHYPQRRSYRQTLRDTWGVARGAYILALSPDCQPTAADLARLLVAAPGHDAVLGYRVPPPRTLSEQLLTTVVGARIADVRDPALGLGLYRAGLRDLLSPEGPDALVHAELFAAAGARGLKTAQVAVAGRAGRRAAPTIADLVAALTHTPAEAVAPVRRGRQGALVGTGMLLAACGLWLLRRWRRPAL